MRSYFTQLHILSKRQSSNFQHSFTENTINPIKNQLQAELCSTLHRRQNGGNKKPNFVVPKNTTINAINNQLRELQNNAQTLPTTNGKTTAESVPTNANTKEKEEKPKLLISHGKPNFKISSNSLNSKKIMEKDESTSSNELIGTLRKRLRSMESLDEIDTIETSSNKSNNSNDKPLDAQKYVPEQHVSRIEANNVPKSPIAPPVFYKASVKNFNTVTSNTTTSEGNTEIKRTIRRLKSVELLEQIEKSNDDKSELNDIQKRIQKLKTVEINKIHSSSNGFSESRTEEHNKIQSNSLRTATETDCFQSSPILPRRAQLFKQQQNLATSKITSPTIHHINHGTLNYKAKPVTSFSRDLQLTPNRYPDKIPVTKTVEPEPVFFSDIKFVINSNGEVVRS